MAALVPYAGRGAVRYAVPLVSSRANKRARVQAYAMAGSALRAGAKYTWRNRKGIARKIRRVYRKSVRARLNKQAPSTSKAKSSSPAVTLTDVNMGTLTMDMCRMPDMSSSNFYNAREGANVYIRGIKVCRYFENTETNRAYEVHHCLIQFKGGTTPEVSAIKPEFFRSHAASNDRVQAFTDYPVVGTATWDMHMNCNQLNPNKEISILWHKRRWLMPKELNTTGNMRHVWKLDKYVPIKKRFSFPYQSVNYPNQPIFELYWYNTITPSDFPGSNQGAVVDVKTMGQTTTYFKDLK